jgi:hypothetical protein
MINIIGTRRLLILVSLFALNLALGALVYLFLIPQKLNKERELKGVQSSISTLQTDIDRMQIEFEQLEAQQERFVALKKKGFFSNQRRRDAEIVFESIQRKAGVVSAVASVLAGSIENNEEAQKADYKVLVSPVKIRIEAIDDVDIYKYIYLLSTYFPGHMTVDKIDLQRNANVSGTVLRSIAGGVNPALVQADVELMWRTMIPKDQVIGGEQDENAEPSQ